MWGTGTPELSLERGTELPQEGRSEEGRREAFKEEVRVGEMPGTGLHGTSLGLGVITRGPD